MNYQRIYNQLIAHASTRSILKEYTEKHHITPKALGGSDDESNMVILTAREHFVAHLLLAKIFGKGMWHAAHMMSNMKRYSSRKYAVVRKEHAYLVGNLMRGKKKPDGFGKRISENKERAKKISASMSGIPKSEEHKKNWKESRQNGLGWVRTEEQNAKLSNSVSGEKNPMFGQTHTEASRNIIAEANRQRIICPHCGKEGGIAIMKRWHFKKCKLKVNHE